MTKAPVLNPILLTHDYWNSEGDRLKAGTVVQLPVAEAKAILAAKKGERADPLPGEL
jgi:hypothetical protein